MNVTINTPPPQPFVPAVGQQFTCEGLAHLRIADAEGARALNHDSSPTAVFYAVSLATGEILSWQLQRNPVFHRTLIPASPAPDVPVDPKPRYVPKPGDTFTTADTGEAWLCLSPGISGGELINAFPGHQRHSPKEKVFAVSLSSNGRVTFFFSTRVFTKLEGTAELIPVSQ
jgi:hypothetical protein